MSSAPVDPSTTSLAVRLRSILPSLSRSEQRVATEVLDDPRGVAASTISELAHRCGTSETTVIRFCRTLGLSGYPQLRLTLATESGRADNGAREVGSDIGPGDDLAAIVEKIAFADARAVEETAAQLDLDVAGGRGRRARGGGPHRRVRRGGQCLRGDGLPAEAAPDRPGRLRLVRHARRPDQRGPAAAG